MPRLVLNLINFYFVTDLVNDMRKEQSTKWLSCPEWSKRVQHSREKMWKLRSLSSGEMASLWRGPESLSDFCCYDKMPRSKAASHIVYFDLWLQREQSLWRGRLGSKQVVRTQGREISHLATNMKQGKWIGSWVKLRILKCSLHRKLASSARLHLQKKQTFPKSTINLRPNVQTCELMRIIYHSNHHTVVWSYWHTSHYDVTFHGIHDWLSVKNFAHTPFINFLFK